MKKGDLVQHIHEAETTIYEVLSEPRWIPGCEIVVKARPVFAPGLMKPLNLDSYHVDINVENLVPANEMLVLALAASE